MGSRVGWEAAKTTAWGIFGAVRVPVGTHKIAHALLVGHTAKGVILGPTTQLALSGAKKGANCVQKAN